MGDPEVGTSVKRFVGFLNHDQLQTGIGFSWFTANELADEDHARHSQLRHLLHEALQLAFEHLTALPSEAEHHGGHR